MDYLITGITGFTGPHLARILLKEGHNVNGLIRGTNGREADILDVITPNELDNIKFHYADLRDYFPLSKLFSSHQFDGVFHLAAQSHPPTSFNDPIGTFNNNVQATVNLVQAISAFQNDCSFMFCSTSEVYGHQSSKCGILTETMPLIPANPYAVSKAAIDLYIQERCSNDYLKGFIVRPFSNTGPRRGMRYSISWDAYQLAMIKLQKKKGNSIPVGNLQSQRVIIDVEDVVRAYYLLMQSFENGEAYNVCGNPNSVCSMEIVTDTLISISGLEGIKKKVNPSLFRQADINIQLGDSSKIQKITGWQPSIPLNETLLKLFKYWLKKLIDGDVDKIESKFFSKSLETK